VHNRQTLAREAEMRGVGLHSGAAVRVRLVPAEAGTGIVFERTDHPGVGIPATLAHVGPSFYATVLQKDGITVSTVEHLMAALYALQIDDLRVEVDGPEVPILDGSSRPFVEAILDAGTVEHPVPRLYLTVIRPVELAVEEKRIGVYPCREFRVTYAIEFPHTGLGYQELTLSVWGADSFSEKLSPARTFTFEAEVVGLRKVGLARGGSLENAVVIGANGLLNPEGLRFPDEFVRHKILDLTGDLSLLGRPLRGHVVAYRAGHDLHGRLARKILDRPDSWFLAPWFEDVPGADGADVRPLPD
jgi:UDP-3-O-[3-hydroxymyristoyl] N-acetylglucosamine deacetylase